MILWYRTSIEAASRCRTWWMGGMQLVLSLPCLDRPNLEKEAILHFSSYFKLVNPSYNWVWITARQLGLKYREIQGWVCQGVQNLDSLLEDTRHLTILSLFLLTKNLRKFDKKEKEENCVLICRIPDKSWFEPDLFSV